MEWPVSGSLDPASDCSAATRCSCGREIPDPPHVVVGEVSAKRSRCHCAAISAGQLPSNSDLDSGRIARVEAKAEGPGLLVAWGAKVLRPIDAVARITGCDPDTNFGEFGIHDVPAVAGGIH